ncbi:MAG: shikimate kinase [Ruminiclostridium sp.]|nr:shikimate kinase [Ruminiclostridium sp.]
MQNIVLIGMPGVGKSTIGVILAKTLGMSFIDTDLIIQENEGKLLQEIIKKDGLDRFLGIEEKVMMSIRSFNTVIATGGSAIYSNKGMQSLKSNGIACYLKLPIKEIQQRINNITTRGIVMKENQSFYELYMERKPLYERYADIIIDCTDKSMECIVSEIKSKL